MYRPEVDGVFYNLDTDELRSLLLMGEARGEPDRGKDAVLHVVTNRVDRGGWFWDASIARNLPDKPYHAVILKNAIVRKKFIYQFSCFQDADPNNPKDDDPNRIRLLKLAYAKEFPLLEKVHILDQDGDPTNGAYYYYADYIPEPYWAKKMTVTARIGHHIFLTDAR